MIRKLEERDIDAIMEIWLEGNIQAHDFIPQDYWKSCADTVRELLPQAEVYVYEDKDGGRISGFIGLDGDHIEGIFVRGSERSSGIGGRLIAYVKERRNALSLNVYKKNERAYEFYRRGGFTVKTALTDSDTGEEEFLLEWKK